MGVRQTGGDLGRERRIARWPAGRQDRRTQPTAFVSASHDARVAVLTCTTTAWSRVTGREGAAIISPLWSRPSGRLLAA